MSNLTTYEQGKCLDIDNILDDYVAVNCLKAEIAKKDRIIHDLEEQINVLEPVKEKNNTIKKIILFIFIFIFILLLLYYYKK